MPNPRLNFDQCLIEEHQSLGVFGMDEVGRGCFAGPVFTAGVFIPHEFYVSPPEAEWVECVQDSKKTTPEARVSVFDSLQHSSSIQCFTASASAKSIDDQGINPSILGCLVTLTEQLACNVSTPSQDPLFNQGPQSNALILMDGRPLKQFPYPAQFIIKGDNQSFAIALASMLAKHLRDQLMKTLHQEHPHYGWDSNVGYGTAKHQQAILSHGTTQYHRLSYLSNLLKAHEEQSPAAPSTQESLKFSLS